MLPVFMEGRGEIIDQIRLNMLKCVQYVQLTSDVTNHPLVKIVLAAGIEPELRVFPFYTDPVQFVQIESRLACKRTLACMTTRSLRRTVQKSDESVC